MKTSMKITALLILLIIASCHTAELMSGKYEKAIKERNLELREEKRQLRSSRDAQRQRSERKKKNEKYEKLIKHVKE